MTTNKTKTTVSGGPAPVDKPLDMDGKRHKIVSTVGPEGGVGKPADRQLRIKNEEYVVEEGNFPPARLIGAGMKAAKKKHGIDPGMPYKELKARHPEVAKTGWRIAHVFWRKEKAADKKPKKKTITERKALNFQQRLKRSRQIRSLAPKLNRGRVRYQFTSPSTKRLMKRSERLARSLVKQKFSPVKGKSYSQLSTSQKIMVDTLVARKQNMIKKLAVRLLPKVRQKAMKRISSFHKNDVDLKIQNLGSHPLAESLNTINALASGNDNKAVAALKEKAKKANVDFESVLEVYYNAIAEYDPEITNLTTEQYAFNAVNSFVTRQINMVVETISTVGHAGKREVDNGKVHDIKHNGKPFGQLHRVGTFKSYQHDNYKLVVRGQPFKGPDKKPIVKTKAEWDEFLKQTTEKHEKRMGVNENMFMAPPWADPVNVAGEIIKTTGIKNAVPVVSKVITDTAKEKTKKTISALRARIKANKEREYD